MGLLDFQHTDEVLNSYSSCISADCAVHGSKDNAVFASYTYNNTNVYRSWVKILVNDSASDLLSSCMYLNYIEPLLIWPRILALTLDFEISLCITLWKYYIFRG